MFVTLCFIKHSISALLRQHEIQSNQITQQHNVWFFFLIHYKAKLKKERPRSLTVHCRLLSHNAMCLYEK